MARPGWAQHPLGMKSGKGHEKCRVQKDEPSLPALGATTDTLLSENGLENRVTNVKNVELIRQIEQVDRMEEEDKKAIEKIVDFALFQYSVKKLQNT